MLYLTSDWLLLSAAFCLLTEALPEREVQVESFKSLGTASDVKERNLILIWIVEPANATLFWMRFYEDDKKNAGAHFYTFDNNRNKTTRRRELGNRTRHQFVDIENTKQIRLTIFPTIPNDKGVFSCELEASGDPQNRFATLKVTEKKETITSSTTVSIRIRRKFTQETSVSTEKETEIIKGYNLGLILGLPAAVIICTIIFAILMIRKRNARHCNQRKTNCENGDLLQTGTSDADR